MALNINTDHVYPPIPVRNFDWCAWYDRLGEEASPYGYGATEQDAINDLIDNYPDEYDAQLEAVAREMARA